MELLDIGGNREKNSLQGQSYKTRTRETKKSGAIEKAQWVKVLADKCGKPKTQQASLLPPQAVT